MLAAWQATIVDESGNIRTNALVEVKSEASGGFASIFSDRDGAVPLANPFSADDDGFARFYAAGGAYRIRAYTGVFERTWRHVPVGTFSEQDASQDAIGRILYPQSSAEVAAPVNYAYAPAPFLDARRFLSGTGYAAAVQTAIDVLHQLGAVTGRKGGTVYLDPSVHWDLGSTTILLYDGIEIVGASMDSTVITYSGSGNAFEGVTRSATRIFRGAFRRLRIQGDGKVASSCGIDCRRVDRWTFEDVWSTDFDIGLRFDGTGSGGYRQKVIGGSYEGNNTGIQIINAANEIAIYSAKIDLNTNYGVDVQDGNSTSIMNCNMESNGVHVRTAGVWTRVWGGRMEASTTRPWETTSAAEYFQIGGGIYFGSNNNAAPLDAGKFTRIDWDDHNSVRGYNLVRNGSFEHWSAGTTSAPDRWTLNGSTTIARDTDAQSGTYSALITAGAVGAGLRHDVDIPIMWRDARREFLVTCRVKLGTSTQAGLVVSPQDSGGTTQGVVLNEVRATAASGRVSTTAAGWHTLKLVARPNSSATRIRVVLEPDNSAGTGTAYFDSVNVSPLGAAREEYYENYRDFAPWMTRIAKANLTHDFDAADGDTTTVTVAGAVVGDPVFVTTSSATTSLTTVRGYVSAADTVTLVKMGSSDPGSLSFIITVILTS